MIVLAEARPGKAVLEVSEDIAEAMSGPFAIIPLTPDAIEAMARADYEMNRPGGAGWLGEPDVVRDHFRNHARRMIEAVAA